MASKREELEDGLGTRLKFEDSRFAGAWKQFQTTGVSEEFGSADLFSPRVEGDFEGTYYATTVQEDGFGRRGAGTSTDRSLGETGGAESSSLDGTKRGKKRAGAVVLPWVKKGADEKIIEEETDEEEVVEPPIPDPLDLMAPTGGEIIW